MTHAERNSVDPTVYGAARRGCTHDALAPCDACLLRAVATLPYIDEDGTWVPIPDGARWSTVEDALMVDGLPRTSTSTHYLASDVPDMDLVIQSSVPNA